MIVVFGAQKGGGGKTTLATNMAVMRARAGRRVLLVDADRNSGSSSRWAAVRVKEGREPAIACVSMFGDTLDAQARQLAQHYEDVIIDCGGQDSPELRSAVLAADALVTPAQASYFDLQALAPLAELLRAVRPLNRGLRACVALNLAPTNRADSDVDEAQDAVRELAGVTLLDGVVRVRKAFRTAAATGAGVVELGDRKAAGEVESIYEEVFA